MAKLVVRNSDGRVKYAYTDESPLELTETELRIGDPVSIIALDINSNEYKILYNADVPEDFLFDKYNYVDGVWTVRDMWKEPEPLTNLYIDGPE